MKYIKNTGRYAVAFTIVKNNKEVKVELDRRRIFTDTGNIATTGISQIEEEDIEELKKQARFNQMLKSGELTILDEADVRTPDENKIKALEDENKELKAQLKKAEKADVKKVEKENKALLDENASLKAQLEALTKKTEDDNKAEETKEPEGF